MQKKKRSYVELEEMKIEFMKEFISKNRSSISNELILEKEKLLTSKTHQRVEKSPKLQKKIELRQKKLKIKSQINLKSSPQFKSNLDPLQ